MDPPCFFLEYSDATCSMHGGPMMQFFACLIMKGKVIPGISR